MTGWPAKLLCAGTRIQMPFRAVCWCANAVAANRRAKTGLIIVVVKDILMIAFQTAEVHAYPKGSYEHLHFAECSLVSPSPLR